MKGTNGSCREVLEAKTEKKLPARHNLVGLPSPGLILPHLYTRIPVFSPFKSLLSGDFERKKCWDPTYETSFGLLALSLSRPSVYTCSYSRFFTVLGAFLDVLSPCQVFLTLKSTLITLKRILKKECQFTKRVNHVTHLAHSPQSLDAQSAWLPCSPLSLPRLSHAGKLRKALPLQQALLT